MNRRAIPGLVAVLAALIAIVVVGRTAADEPTPVFAVPEGSWMPAVTDAESLTGTWFCPGVPATGEAGVGGEVVVSNRNAEQIVGRFTVLGEDGVAAEQEFDVAPWSQQKIDVDAFVTTAFASVVVEIEGGQSFVEQVAQHPAGDSVSPCSDDTSAEWYLADGFTAGGSIETLVLTNPYDYDILTDLAFANVDGPSRPNAFQGYPIPARSVRVIPIAELGNRDETVIAASVEARQGGRLIVGRAQHYTGEGRLGYDVTLAAPSTRDQWWFADGERGEGISETFAIFNPTDDEVTVDVFFLGLPIESEGGGFAPIPVPPRDVVVFAPFVGSAGADAGGGLFETPIPDGRHGVVFSTLAAESIVVERVITRPVGDSIATTVTLGAPLRRDGYIATRWHIGIGPAVPTEDALVIYNVDLEDALVTVQAVGPGGPSPVRDLTDLLLPAGGLITVDLIDPDVLGQELIVSTENRVFIERSLERGGGLSGRSASWALPASGR